MRDVFFAVQGVRCPCGLRNLVVILPGEEPGAPIRGWCSIEHARLDGWPWLKPGRARARKASPQQDTATAGG